jgi:hypothetical protein
MRNSIRKHKRGESPLYLVEVKKDFGEFSQGDKIILSPEEFERWRKNLKLIKRINEDVSIIK